MPTKPKKSRGGGGRPPASRADSSSTEPKAGEEKLSTATQLVCPICTESIRETVLKLAAHSPAAHSSKPYCSILVVSGTYETNY